HPCSGSECPGGCDESTALTYSFSTFFRPTVIGQSSCVVHVGIDNLDRPLTISGNGMVQPQIVDVQPMSVAFGDVRRNGGTSGSLPISVRSAGGSTLTVSSVTVSAGFAITLGPPSVSLPSGVQQGYNVVCNSATVGAVSGNFRVESNDPARPVVNTPLTCNVVDSSLDVTPNPATIPSSRVGEPRTLPVSLRNTGGASMTINSVSVTGPGMTLMSGPPAGTVLAANGGTATANVRFD